MRKMRKRKILSFFLSCVLVLSMVLSVDGVSYAADDNIDAKGKVESATAAVEVSKNRTVTDYQPLELAAKTITTSETSVSYTKMSYEPGCADVYAITPKNSGRLCLDIKVDGEDTSDNVFVAMITQTLHGIHMQVTPI